MAQGFTRNRSDWRRLYMSAFEYEGRLNLRRTKYEQWHNIKKMTKNNQSSLTYSLFQTNPQPLNRIHSQIKFLFRNGIASSLCHNYNSYMKLLKLYYRFARRATTPELSYEQIADAKCERLQHFQHKYDYHQKYTHEDKFFEQYVYGHTCYISGLTTHNFQSQKYAKSMMKYAQPNLLLLGGLSDNYLRLYEQHFKIRQHYEHPIHRPQKMNCKERISRLIQQRLEKDINFYWDDTKKEIRTIELSEKRILPQDYLTVAHLASLEDNTKVALGKPSDTLVFQDLIMRYSLQQLKQLAQEAVTHIMTAQPKEKLWRLSFTREAVQNYIMSEHPQLFSREVTYQAALLKRFAKIQDKIVMFVPAYFAGRIASQVHQVDLKPQNVYRVGLQDPNSEIYSLYQKTLSSNPQEILQKFCLLTLLKQSWLELEFANGTNVFRCFCFSKLFEGMSMEQLRERYMRAKRSVEGRWYELIRQRVKNVHLEVGSYYRMNLKEQFQVLQERANQHFPYTYEEKNYLSIHQNNAKLEQVERKMREMLNQEGDRHKIQLFDDFMRGDRSKDGIILYSKLLGKANIESYDRLKLPIFHYGAFRGIYKQYLRDFLLKAEQNSKFQQKLKKKQKLVEEFMDRYMKKLDNPDELQNVISGKKGKVFSLSFDPNQGPQISQEEMENMKDFFGKMTPNAEKEIREQFGDDWFKVEKEDDEQDDKGKE